MNIIYLSFSFPLKHLLIKKAISALQAPLDYVNK